MFSQAESYLRSTAFIKWRILVSFSVLFAFFAIFMF